MIATYKLKDAFKRGGTLLGAAVLMAGLVVSAFPASVFADALNPLTERSLTLSSSSPGWSYLDGSGNATYAYPNSGANGQKTGNTFSFRVSSDATVKAVTFQYCTTPAGNCRAPGDNTYGAGTGTITVTNGLATVSGDATNFDTQTPAGSLIRTAGGETYRVLSVQSPTSLTLTDVAAGATETDVAFSYRSADTTSKSDLNIVFPSMDLISNTGSPSDWERIAAGTDAVPGHTPLADGTEGEFAVLTGDAANVVSGTGTGTITTVASSATVTGSGTSFTTELAPGSEIVTDANRTYTVLEIASDTSLTITANVATGEGEVGSDFDFTNLGNATTYVTATDWDVTASNQESGGTMAAGTVTGQDNLITMTSATGVAMTFEDYMKVIFYGTTANYITNPGSGAFFVRINTYSDDVTLDDTTLIDGGVTVANVMNESISIQTKVLETMAFSVGTHDPNKYTEAQLNLVGLPDHGQCSTLLMADPLDPSIDDDSVDGTTEAQDYAALSHNVLQLGDPGNEYSLETGSAHTVESYWRLSSNSSGGATVYYTGHTLTNTVGDEILPLTEASGGTSSNIGNEQFGLGIASDDDATLLGAFQTYPVWENDSPLYDSYGDLDALGDGDFGSFLYNAYTLAGGDSVDDNDIYAHYPRLYPLIPMDPYGDHDNSGSGSAAGTITSGGTAKFAFDDNADTYARPIATESTQVVNCVTAKMRYIANIAATTPAGIYTTKINYVASPQY